MECGNPASGDALMNRRPKYDKSNVCAKCKEQAGKIVVRHAVFCKDCFTSLVATKFRRAIQHCVEGPPTTNKRKTLKASGNILVAFSGGPGSSVLLDLIYRSYFAKHETIKGGTKHPRNARVWDEGAVVYVETGAAYPDAVDCTSEIQRAIDKYPLLSFVPLRLEHAFDTSWWSSVDGRPTRSAAVDLATEDLIFSSCSATTDPKSLLTSYLASLPTQTSVASAIQTLIRILLLHTAESIGASHLALGTSLTSLSISMISAVAQGAGFNIQEETEEQWRSTPDASPVRVVRPLQDLGTKECAFWAWWHGVQAVSVPRSYQNKQDIGRMTRDFITGLERDYPSTVSTIVRTCAKLAPKRRSDGACVLCQRPVQEGVREWKAHTAMRSLEPDAEAFAEPDASHLALQLCYACHTTLTSRNGRGKISSDLHRPVVLPVWTSAQLVAQKYHTMTLPTGGEPMSDRKMKSMISDFLIGEE
ncbi:hypothetical protein FISHEDRAFT_63791 [Fistulina hepatica ATCC 64428]|uniref:Cytoplasmic tRNA 2-thiolation protein 2 n=1 Tax=Fistulina hepatica ATCC 64428 TaxID=1128425 RepID=A0A0D7AKX4_9AGAR|nr:hypothetical protein FISHEDRAFT_63791 [Fistulina hepatica ATCC 64428]